MVMGVFQDGEHSGHEAVIFCSEAASGLRAIIAVHSTARGPAFGGCRMRAYATEQEALQDVLRLSRGMSYKNALAGLAFGGGKAVIICDPARKTPGLLRAFGRQVDKLGGTYVTAEDSNGNTPHIAVIREATAHVRNLPFDESGDPSIVTAWGVMQAIRAAFRHKGLSVARATFALEGLGSVGMRLAGFLHEAGARLIVSDVDAAKVEEARSRYAAEVAAVGQAHAATADAYVPCALGGTLNERSIPQLKARIVVGAANNQLESLFDRVCQLRVVRLHGGGRCGLMRHGSDTRTTAGAIQAI